MRLSVDSNDPGNMLYGMMGSLGRQVRVFLGGKEVRDVITADDEEGFVLHFERDADGNVFAIGDEVATETLTGDVKIVLPEGAECYRNYGRRDPVAAKG